LPYLNVKIGEGGRIVLDGNPGKLVFQCLSLLRIMLADNVRKRGMHAQSNVGVVGAHRIQEPGNQGLIEARPVHILDEAA
jgi:hypothetical protein